MKNPHEKFNNSLIVSRLQQIELASLKPSLSLDSPFFHLLTVTAKKPFFDNLPLGLGMEFHLIGSKILGVHIDRGYFCHDLEASLSDMSPCEAFVAISRLNLASPIFYQAALFLAYKRLAEEPIHPKQIQFFTIAMEFARITHHLLVIKNVFYCLKLTSLAETVVDCEEILRPPRQLFNCLRTQLDSEVNPLSLKELGDILDNASTRAEELAFAMSREEKIKGALRRKAIVSLSQAGGMGLTGSYLRANQDFYDLRRQNDYGFPYKNPPRISTGESGDAWMRFSLRSMDVLASLQWLKQTFTEMSSTIAHVSPLIIDNDFCRYQPRRSFAFGEIEGPEGDIKASIFVTRDQKPLFRIRSPAYFIAAAIPQLLAHLDLSQVAVVLFSLGITAEEVDK